MPCTSNRLPCNLSARVKADDSLYPSAFSFGVYLSYHRKGILLPNFILYISAGILILLSLAALIPGDYVPEGALPLTLEVSILIPMLILYMHKKRFINHFLKQIGSCNKRLYAQGAEAAVVSARIALIFGILHFIIISIVIICQNPLSSTSKLTLYKVLPPIVFVMSILFNQIAIRFFNHLMSHTEYVPIVNTKGDVIGKTPAVEAINYKNAYINPVIRIAISTHGMLFLCDRPSTAILDKNKTDIPLECYLRFGESLSDGVNRLLTNAFAQAKEVKSLQSPRQWHVSISGNDSADGSATAPLRHIQTAAERAYPGDVVIVHEGVYRERVAPPRGGESKERPITYQVAEGEKVDRTAEALWELSGI